MRSGRGAALFKKWPPVGQTADLAKERRRFVLRLINVPKGYRFGAGLKSKTPEPITDLPVTVKLPAGAEVKGAWVLPFPESHQTMLHGKRDDAITFTVPEVKHWTVVVIDYESGAGLEADTNLPTPYREW